MIVGTTGQIDRGRRRAGPLLAGTEALTGAVGRASVQAGTRPGPRHEPAERGDHRQEPDRGR